MPRIAFTENGTITENIPIDSFAKSSYLYIAKQKKVDEAAQAVFYVTDALPKSDEVLSLEQLCQTVQIKDLSQTKHLNTLFTRLLEQEAATYTFFVTIGSFIKNLFTRNGLSTSLTRVSELKTKIIKKAEDEIKELKEACIKNNTHKVREIQGENLCDDKEDTPLHWACEYGSLEVTSLLLEKNVNLSAKNKSGSTPLHKAFYGGHYPIIQFLIRKKANLGTLNHWALTPFHYALLYSPNVLFEKDWMYTFFPYVRSLLVNLNHGQKEQVLLGMINDPENLVKYYRKNPVQNPVHFAFLMGRPDMEGKIMFYLSDQERNIACKFMEQNYPDTWIQVDEALWINPKPDQPPVLKRAGAIESKD